MNKNIIMEYIDEENADMVKLVNIDNFIKCMCAASSKTFNEVMANEDCIQNIARYLNTWAKNKRWLFEGFYDHKLTIDTTFERVKTSSDWEKEFDMLCEKPANEIYYPYLRFLEAHTPICGDGLREGFTSFNQYCNYDRIDGWRYLPSNYIHRLDQMKELKLTTIASKFFNLPSTLVDELGRMLDSNKDNCNFTLSIDPVDIITCSITPYNWHSCYAIGSHNGSHADGAIAAMIDSNTQIIIGWKDKGKYKLDGFELKDFKFKIFRAWLNTSQDFNVIHVASAYPYRDSDHTKAIREKVEEIICGKTGKENLWGKAPDGCEINIDRKLLYGYNEFSESSVYIQKELKEKIVECPGIASSYEIEVYDECIFSLEDGDVIIGSCENYIDDDDFYEFWDYNSDVIYDNYYDAEADCYDEEAYEEDRENERSDMWQAYIEARGTDDIARRYGIECDDDYLVCVDGCIGRDDLREMYLNCNGLLEY